jgi:hypothetical protein
MVYETSDGNAIGWSLTRSSDGHYFNDTTGAFQAGAVTNEFTPDDSQVISWGCSKLIDMGAAGLTATITITTTETDQAVRPYHVQLGALPYGGPLIVTNGAAVSRAADIYSIVQAAKSTLRCCWWPDRGTAFFRFKPAWDAADQSGDVILLYLAYDADNVFCLKYDGAANDLVFEATTTGKSQTVTYAWTPVRGTWYAIACQWEVVDGVMDLSLYVAGSEVGTKAGDSDAVPVEVDPSTWYLGSNAGANPAAGYFTPLWITQNVLREEEIARLP